MKILVDHPNLEIVFCVDADGEHPSHRPLQLRFALIADHNAGELESILDSCYG